MFGWTIPLRVALVFLGSLRKNKSLSWWESLPSVHLYDCCQVLCSLFKSLLKSSVLRNSVLYVLYVCMLWACMYCVLFCVVVLSPPPVFILPLHRCGTPGSQSSSHHTCSRSPINPSPLKSPLFVSRGCWMVVCWFAFVLSCGRALAELWLFCWLIVS